MSYLSHNKVIKFLDQSIRDFDDLERVDKILQKVKRCRDGIEAGHNLADIIGGPKNEAIFEELFGDELDKGYEFLTRNALQDYQSTSITVHKDITEEKKLVFLYKAMADWKQFDMVISILHKTNDGIYFKVINPLSSADWKNLGEISAGSVLNVFVKNKKKMENSAHLILALERCEALIDSIQDINDTETMFGVDDEDVNKIYDLNRKRNINRKTSASIEKKKTRKRRPVKKVTKREAKKFMGDANVVINKQDTFVHAGNAHLIMTVCKKYDGRVEMFVMRGKKDPVLMDADSIWAKEIRNGEEVLYEFWGFDEPTEEFVSELLESTNKYTQMDKMLLG